jgi:hypothetical protein
MMVERNRQTNAAELTAFNAQQQQSRQKFNNKMTNAI